MAALFSTCYDAKCSAFQITRLIYVHCVSKEEFSVHLKGFPCAALCCKEIHWSYLESMAERRVCLVPKFNDDALVEELFDGLSSPVLIRTNSSCDITFVNPDDNSEESTGALIWDFEVLRRNSSAAVVQASTIFEAKAIDGCCQWLNATAAISHEVWHVWYLLCPKESVVESGPESPDLSIQDDEHDDSDEEHDQDRQTNDDLQAESFQVKGSFHEERYQQALSLCDNAKR
ncbi:hypothetical protein OS493_024312 [Desmophyllum pertusum]|uniref:Uncharacterized protein n=1 Tax=Desmophyllum pertusum TaxID=174260 RepID=A0A9W9Z0V8_9CNID|nr:hypothetical protein OS493_024312 [Desmophyllum pertusum]